MLRCVHNALAFGAVYAARRTAVVVAATDPHFHKHQAPIRVAQNQVHFTGAAARARSDTIIALHQLQALAKQIVQGLIFTGLADRCTAE